MSSSVRKQRRFPAPDSRNSPTGDLESGLAAERVFRRQYTTDSEKDADGRRREAPPSSVCAVQANNIRAPSCRAPLHGLGGSGGLVMDSGGGGKASAG